MTDAVALVGGGLVIAGALAAILGAVGVWRFPDVFTRIHAASLTDTGAASLVLLGLALVTGWSGETLKLALVWVFVMLTTPAASSALASAAFGSGHRPHARDPGAADSAREAGRDKQRGVGKRP